MHTSGGDDDVVAERPFSHSLDFTSCHYIDFKLAAIKVITTFIILL